MRFSLFGAVAIVLLIAPAVLGFQGVEGGRGLYRIQDARSEGYGWLTIKTDPAYHYLQRDTFEQHMVNMPIGISYAFTDWLEIAALPGFAAAGNRFGSVLPGDLNGGLTDLRAGGKVCLTSWLPVLKLGGMGYYQWPMRAEFDLLNPPIPYGLLINRHWAARGLLTLNLQDILSNVPFSISANYGRTWGGTYGTNPEVTSENWVLAGIGAEISTKAVQGYLEMTEEHRQGEAFFSPDALQRITGGARFRLGPIGFGIAIERGLSNNLPPWTYGLGINFASPVGRPPIGSIAGTVVDARTGMPLSGYVTLPQVKAFRNRRLPIGADGTFRIDKVPTGSVLLKVSVPEYQEFSGFVAVENEKVAIQEIRLRPLKQFGTITGRITDARTGAPIAASIRFPGSELSEQLADAATGVFMVRDVPVGVIAVEVAAEGYQTSSASVTVKDNEVTTQNFELRPLKVFGTITGRVLDANTKQPLAATISFPEDMALPAVETDAATGVFTASMVPVGTVTATASAPSYLSESKPVVVEEGKVTNVEYLLRPAEEFGGVSGTVTDATNGKPVSAQISFADPNLPQVTTDPNTGFYKIEQIPVGTTVIKATADGYFPAQMTVTIEVNRVIVQNFALNPSAQLGELSGIVTDVKSKATLAATIYFPTDTLLPSTVSDSATGFYKFSVPAGTYVVECRREGYATARSSSPVVIKKGETTILNFQLEKIGTEEVLLADVTFEFNKAELRPSAYPVLDLWVKKLKDNPYMLAEIQGHTDAVGSESYNQQLSERRANAVVAYLISKGIEPHRLIARGYGESQLLINTQAKEERNRRVVFKNLGDIKK